jgi:Gpi18-like mannosyltransferase
MVNLKHRKVLVACLSVIVQLPLAAFLGHFFDQRIFLQTGYLVGSGLNPYQPHLVNVFPNPYLTGINPIIGYPPLLPLLLGSIYRLTYNLAPNLFFYNFATKLPIIASNIALAYLTERILQKQDASPNASWFAFVFLLFNPFTLLTTTAWGQFDTFVALLCMASFYLLSKGKTTLSSLLLALGFVLKPISLSLLGLPLLYSTPNNRQKNLIHLSMIIVVTVAFCLLPFYILGWILPVSTNQLTSYFVMAGGMTLFNLLDVFQRTPIMPVGLEFLGYLWIPALGVVYSFIYRHKPKNLTALAQCTTVLLLVFFLFRSWLSEQNINLLFPFLLILLSAHSLSKQSFHLSWVIPFIYLVVNASVVLLLFLVCPAVIPLRDAFDLQFGTARLAIRFAVTVLWYILACSIFYRVVKKSHRLSA